MLTEVQGSLLSSCGVAITYLLNDSTKIREKNQETSLQLVSIHSFKSLMKEETRSIEDNERHS